MQIRILMTIKQMKTWIYLIKFINGWEVNKNQQNENNQNRQLKNKSIYLIFQLIQGLEIINHQLKVFSMIDHNL